MIFENGIPSCGMANWKAYMRNNLIAIAARYGGFKEEQTDFSMLAKIERVNEYENKFHRLAEVLCDGEPHGFATMHTISMLNSSIGTHQKNENVADAERSIDEWGERIKNELASWYVDEDKFKDEFFINTDPRGYALKLNFGGERVEGVYTDWGGYGIIAPDDF